MSDYRRLFVAEGPYFFTVVHRDSLPLVSRGNSWAMRFVRSRLNIPLNCSQPYCCGTTFIAFGAFPLATATIPHDGKEGVGRSPKERVLIAVAMSVPD